jgi:hypothetical protein
MTGDMMLDDLRSRDTLPYIRVARCAAKVTLALISARISSRRIMTRDMMPGEARLVGKWAARE